MISLSVTWVQRIIRAIGVVNILFAAIGGCLAAFELVMGGFVGVQNSPTEPYVRQVYFIFTFMDAACLVMLVIGSAYLLRLKRLGLRICNWVFATEIARFFASSLIPPALFMSGRTLLAGSIAAAGGIGSAAIVLQIITGYPVLALIVLNLSRRGFSNGAVHTPTTLPTTSVAA
jgi:hypothetical protein